MTTSRLPLRELPLSGESLTGYLRRHVMAMGYQGLRQLLGLIEDASFPAHLDHLREGSALTSLAQFLRRDTSVLGAMTAHRWAESLVFRRRKSAASIECDSKTLLRYFHAAQSRICPRCLADAPELDRLIWSFRPLGICLEHGTPLLARCPGCRRSLSPLQLNRIRCRCGRRFDVEEAVLVGDSLRKLAAETDRWLNGATCDAFDLPPYAVFWWVDRLRAAVSQTTNWIARVREEWNLSAELDPESIAWSAAVDLAHQGPPRLAEFLEVYQTTDKHRSASTGVGRAFGTLLRDADRLERYGFPVPADVLRDYLTARYDRGHLSGKVILFRSALDRRRLTGRPWLTQTAAARRLGVRPPTIADLVRRGALVGRIELAGRKGRTVGVVRRESLEALRAELAETLGTVEAGNLLGVERHRVLDLIHAGILSKALRTAGGWRVARRSVAELLGRLASLPCSAPEQADLISLYEAVRRFGVGGLTLVRCIERILTGQLSAYRSAERPTLRNVVFELADIRRAANETRNTEEQHRGYPLNRLARILVPDRPLKEIVLRKWIAAGLLRARRRRKAWCVAPMEVARFRSTYCLADQACRRLGVTRSTLARWEVERLIAPIYGRATHAGAGASVFLRADVERLAVDRAA